MDGAKMHELAEMYASLGFSLLMFWPSVFCEASVNFCMALDYDDAGYDYSEISALLAEFPELPGGGE